MSNRPAPSLTYDRIAFEARPVAASGAETQTFYYVTERALLLKQLWLIGINPAAADGDTLSVVVDYSTDGSAFTMCGTIAATEYNDTDNTLALTDLLPDEQIALGAWTVDAVPVGALVRIRLIWAGTVTDGHAHATVIAAAV